MLLPTWLLSLLPARASVSQAERLRSGAGALVGILVTGVVGAALLHRNPDPHVTALWLIAPMGASAVLLFAIPGSPLAQPWSILGGNIVSAIVGVACAKMIGSPVLAASAAIFLAILAMFVLHCLHPPGGAIALTAVLGGPDIHAAGYAFVLFPVAANSLILLVAAVLYNKAAGRRYPHTQQAEPRHAHLTDDRAPTARLGFTPDDLQTVLREHDQVLDISIDDLEDLFRRTEMHAFRRRFGEKACVEIMSRDILTVEFATELSDAWELMRQHDLQALPVIDRARHVIGIVTRADFLRHADAHATDAADLAGFRGLGRRLHRLLARTTASHSDKADVVGQIMASPVRTAKASAPLVELVPLMSDAGWHHIPVVNEASKLVGMVTQTDLVAALYETTLAHLGGGLPAVQQPSR